VLAPSPVSPGRVGTAVAISRAVRRYGKPLVMPALAARSIGAAGQPGCRSLVLAQAFSWGGDVALMGRGRGPFLIGLGSFLAAQVAYISAYRCRSSTFLFETSAQRRIMTTGTVAAVAMALVAGRQDRMMTVPVAAYGITLSTMVAAASGVHPDQGRPQLLAGACLFLLSDTLIGIRRFVLRDRTRVLETAVMSSYVAAQWCISDGMLTVAAGHGLAGQELRAGSARREC
jgi:uncharacterized membrane protein YhhN